MSDMDLFVGLSSALTGIAQEQLAPTVDPLNVKQAYFDQAKTDPAFAQMLQIYAANQSKPPDQIADIILNQSGNAVRYLGRAVMLEWYTGSWYPPASLQTSSPNPNNVVSADAYTTGWMWNVAQAHPMGYSNLHFGYWSSPPPSLNDYTGGGAS
jgi:hypothetical protein